MNINEEFELYLPETPGPHPLICITPLLGRLFFLDDLILERYFARFFRKHGFAAVVACRPIFEFNPERGLEQVQHYLDLCVMRNKWILDELLQRKEIDPERVGTYGASFGAVVNAVWAGEDERLKAHVFALGGGNLPEIMLTCRDPLMLGYVKAMKKKTGLKEGALLEAVKKVFFRDPLEAAKRIPTQSVCLHLALFDRVVRPRYAFAFRRALGNPETVFIPLGHYTSILSIPFLQPQVLRFFRRRFGLS